MDGPTRLDRLVAALRGLAVGEAMGRATEHYTAQEIIDVYEGPVTEFVEPVRAFDDEEWSAGEVGAFTRLVTALADAAVAPEVRWLEDAAETDRLAEAVADGLRHSLDGLLAAPPRPAAHAAIAVGVAAACAGHTARDVLLYARTAVDDAGSAGLADAIGLAGRIAEESGGRQPGIVLTETFPPTAGVDALVPFIFGIVYGTQSARRAIVEAVNQGGPAPAAAAIAGAICAAAMPGTLPRAWAAEVEQINQLDLEGAAQGYLGPHSGDDAAE